jgi:predicted neuraminidase
MTTSISPATAPTETYQVVKKTVQVAKVEEHLLWNGLSQLGCKTGSLVQTNAKTVLAAWYGCQKEAKTDSEETALWISSYYNGEWNAPRQVFSKEGFHIWNPVFLKSISGEIVLFFRCFQAQVPEPQKEKYGVRDFQYLSMRSQNNGETWSLPIELPHGVTGPVKCSPVVLQDGTWIIPSAKNGECWIEISPDEGKTFERVGPIKHPDGKSGLTEPCLIPDAHGEIKIFFRNRQKENNDRYVLTTTFDLTKKTFSPLRQTTIQHPDAGIDALRLPNGDLLMVANTSFDQRTPLSLLSSHDNGENWKELLVLEKDDGDFAQPAIIQTLDHKVHLIYYWWPKKTNEKNIKHVVIN